MSEQLREAALVKILDDVLESVDEPRAYRAAILDGFRAKLSAAQPASPASLPVLYLTARQIRTALEWALPEGSSADDLDATWRIGTREAGADEEGEPYSAGLVMWMDDYPEEGCLPLDVPDATPQPSPTGPVEAQEQPAGEALDWVHIGEDSYIRKSFLRRALRTGESVQDSALDAAIAYLRGRPQAASSPTGPREGEPKKYIATDGRVIEAAYQRLNLSEVPHAFRPGIAFEAGWKAALASPETPSVRSLGERNSGSVHPAQASALQAVPHDSRSTGASWISIEDKLPAPQTAVLVYAFYSQGVARYSPSRRSAKPEWDWYPAGAVNGWECEVDRPVTHWMPLPEPPDNRPEAAISDEGGKA